MINKNNKIYNIKKINIINPVIIYILLIITMTSEVSFVHADNTEVKNVLVLNSYHSGYEWSDRLMEGIEAAFADSGQNIVVEIEYLDAKRKNDSIYMDKLYDVFKYKYKDKKYDVIISSDNDAFNFLLTYRDKLFQDTPVVFCGVNNFEEEMLNGYKNYTGVVEEENLTGTIDIALKQYPAPDRLVLIVDKTTTGNAFKSLVEDYMSMNKRGIKLDVIAASLISDVEQQVSKLESSSIIFLAAPVLKDTSGKLLKLNESSSRLSKLSKVPIYSAWEFYIGHGIVGGVLASGYTEGQRAAALALEILNGKKVQDLPVERFSSKNIIFDYSQLKRYGINIAALPKESVYFNKPAPSIVVQKSMIWISLLIAFIVLAMINLMMLANIKKRIHAERELGESEEQLRTFINGMPDIVCFKNEEGKWLEANEAGIAFFGLGETNYKGKTSDEMSNINPNIRDTFLNCKETDEQVWEKQKPVNYEETIILDDGTEKILDVIKTPLFHLDGSRKGIIVLGRDITERKKAIEALGKNEEILRATLNATADGILVVGNDRKIIDSNDLFQKMWRIPDKLLLTLDELKLIDFVLSQIEKPYEFRQWVNDCYRSSQSDFMMVTFKDGRVYEVFSEPLIKKGLVAGRVWSFKDITLRKKMEKEFSESEERYRRLVELSPDAIYMSVDGKNIFSNSSGAKLLEVDDTKELIGKPILGFVYSDFYDTASNKIRDVRDGKAVLPLIEKRLIKSDGSMVDIEVASTYFEYKGKTALMSVVRDITERKRAQELRQKVEENTKLLKEAIEYDKLKTEFFANISHEFRTPLNIILGAQQLFKYILKDSMLGESKEKVDKYLKIMKQNCYRLLRLVNNLIDITRIDAGFFNIQLKNRNIVNIVEEITLSVAEYIENKGISLQFDTDVEEKIIACDADKIERIVLNLLSNATKFTEPGDSIEVFVKDKGSWIAIYVKDTGIGIPKDKQEIIFERFRQVDKSFIRNHEGSGIGLSIVKSLVELHGGAVRLDSELGEGTTFIIDLPVTLMSEEYDNMGDDSNYQSRIESINVEFSDIYL